MRVLSLFDGISCARVALERAGIPVEEYYACEIDKYAISISQKNYPDIVKLGDVKNVATPCSFVYKKKIDLLIGGSPCQDLSIAGKRKGLEGERSGLFWEYVRILREVKPKYFILENVASMPKEVKEIITKELGFEPIMINASLVSAQQRKRLFWTNIPGVILPEDRNILLKDIIEDKVGDKYIIEGVALRNRGGGKKPEYNLKEKANAMTTVQTDSMISIRIGDIGSTSQAHRVYSTDGKSVALSALGGGQGAKTGLYLVVPEATKKGFTIAQDGDSVDFSFPNSSTRRGRVGKKAKNLMTSQNIGVFTGGVVRKLTPTECERLQGLPDGYTEGVSDTQRYKMLGNAFNVDVIAHILNFIPKI